MFRGFVFSATKFIEKSDPKDIVRYLKNVKNKVWIDLEDPTDKEMDFLIDEFDFHPLSIEDAMIVQDHPKIEEFDDYIMMIMYQVRLLKGEIKEDQLNIFFGKNFIITIHEDRIRAIESVVKRAKGKIKTNFHRGIDLVLHAIVDNVVDEYFPVIDKIEDKLDRFEDEILEGKDFDVIDEIIEQKRNILDLRKILISKRPVINKLCRTDVDYIRKSTVVYFRDIYDHVAEMSANLENMRDLIPSLMDAYNSLTVKKTNEHIHRLTIVATIAVPLTVITSFYGMNIYIPETKWGVWGYVFVTGLLAVTALLTYIFLRRKK